MSPRKRGEPGPFCVAHDSGCRRGRLTLPGTIVVTGSRTQEKREMLLILRGCASGRSNTVRCQGQRT